MRFIIDAQLPISLSHWIQDEGFYSLHTLELPDKNKTTDKQINKLSIKENLIVITKDSDFFDSFLINKEPFKLLLVSTGNIGNKKLLTIFENNFKLIVRHFENNSVLEITENELLIHY